MILQVEGAGWDSGMVGMFDAAGICLFFARVFLLLLLPLAPTCAGCGGRMLGIAEGSGAGDGRGTTFSGSFPTLETGVCSGGGSFSTLAPGFEGATFSLFFSALPLATFFRSILSSAAA